ncbi:hypothetical protein KEM48_003455, partial [Puccinia striiformis f. sp. tritici PST-130]
MSLTRLRIVCQVFLKNELQTKTAHYNIAFRGYYEQKKSPARAGRLRCEVGTRLHFHHVAPTHSVPQGVAHREAKPGTWKSLIVGLMPPAAASRYLLINCMTEKIAIKKARLTSEALAKFRSTSTEAYALHSNINTKAYQLFPIDEAEWASHRPQGDYHFVLFRGNSAASQHPISHSDGHAHTHPTPEEVSSVDNHLTDPRKVNYRITSSNHVSISSFFVTPSYRILMVLSDCKATAVALTAGSPRSWYSSCPVAPAAPAAPTSMPVPTPVTVSPGDLQTLNYPPIVKSMAPSTMTALPATYTAGTPSPIRGAPPLPSANLNVALYPALDRLPPLDSPLVKEWMSKIDWSKAPTSPPTGLGGCRPYLVPPLLNNLDERTNCRGVGLVKKVIKDVLGVTPNTMRPPYGDIDDRVRYIAMAMGLTPIIWTTAPSGQTFDTQDWKISTGIVTPAQVLKNFQAIIAGAPDLPTGFI